MPDNNELARIAEPVDIFQLLDRVRLRPSMYLRRKSLLEIETVCSGYSAGLNAHGIKEAGSRFNQDFAEYLEKRFKWSLCQGWACAIRMHSKTSRQAFDRFFALLADFKRAG
jgi:hypothetical protein